MKKKRQKLSLSKAIYNALEKPKHPLFQFSNRALGLLTLISVAAVILETVVIFEPYLVWLTLIEIVSVGIFTLEYIIRTLETKPRRKYLFSFFGIVDLLAILPSYLGLGNLTFLKAARSVRIIRLLRMLRLAKVARFKDENEGARSVLGINFEIYVTAFFMALLSLGSLLYIFEATQPEASDIPSGMYWALRVILGGLPVAQPETFGGTIVIILARFTSMILFGIVIGLVGVMLRRILIGADKDVN
jgi:voltage-gated potassium channel